MGFNSPIPGKYHFAVLQDETRKATKIMRSFVDNSNNGLDKVIPRSVLERAAGFAIFTVVKAGFMFSARAGSGVVIARLPDGSWSAPSAIGLGGFGFGGQIGAEVTDFLIVLNSRSAVKSFMSAGSLTLGGNLSVAVGPLGRNAEGSGAVNTKGKVAAMYSYSKTKGLFGGVSVEGSVILERQDANRLAYGSAVSSKQLLSGDVEPPEWAYCLTHEIEKCTGLPGGQKWRADDEDGEGGAMGWETPTYENERERGGRSRGGSLGQGYVFGDGIGPGGRNSPSSSGADGGPAKTGRRRAGTLLDAVSDRVADRPTAKRASSFLPFGSGSNSPKKSQGINSPSSENYNAGLTWDSDGPMTSYATRPRSGSTPLRQSAQAKTLGHGYGSSTRSPFENPPSRYSNDLDDPHESDLLDDHDLPSSTRKDRNRYDGDGDGAGEDLLGTWKSDGERLTGSFGKMNLNTASGSSEGYTSSPMKGRSRSNSKTQRGQTFEEIPERWDDDSFATSQSTHGVYNKSSSNGRNGNGFSNGVNAHKSPFDGGSDYDPPSRSVPPPLPRSSSGISTSRSRYENYPRAMALYDFKPTDPGDLGLRKGQIVVVLDKVGAAGEWWKGVSTEVGSGKEGIFPNNYVEVIELPKDLRGGLGRSELRSRMIGNEWD